MSDKKTKSDKKTVNVVTANRLNDGFVVFLTVNDRWTENIAGAKTFDATAMDALPPSVLNGVIDPYTIEVNPSGVPVKFREQLRAFGPSSHQRFRRCPGGSGLYDRTTAAEKAAA